MKEETIIKEENKIKVEKSLCFEESGEIISVCIMLENISPQVRKKESFKNTVDRLLQEAIESIQ